MDKELISTIKEIQENLKTQNNRCSEFPNFEVQALRKKIVPEGYHESCYLRDVGCELEIHDFMVDSFGEISLDDEMEQKLSDYDLELDDLEVVYYVEEWETIQTFLTEVGAQAFIDRKAHDYEKLRIYGNSIYYNMEQRNIREFLMKLDLDKIEVNS